MEMGIQTRTMRTIDAGTPSDLICLSLHKSNAYSDWRTVKAEEDGNLLVTIKCSSNDLHSPEAQLTTCSLAEMRPKKVVQDNSNWWSSVN